MIKILEIIGFGLLGVMIYSFVGLIPHQDPIGWPLFWGCAAGTLGIIMYRKWKKKHSKTQ